MLVFEAKLQGTSDQCERLDEAIRTGRFVRNMCLRYWLDGHAKSRNDLNKYCKVLADDPEFPWVKKLNSMARQAMAERTWAAIARFFDNCKKRCSQQLQPSGNQKPLRAPGKNGFPKFKRHQTRASVEYKTSGWALSEDRRYITFRDGFEAGTFKLWGTRDLHYYQIEQIKRVRVVRRSDGYYAQFCLDVERSLQREPTGKTIGLDVGLSHFYTDSNGGKVENPRFLRKSEKALKRAQRRLSRKEKRSNNRTASRIKLGKKHLKIQRQRKDFVVKLARSVVLSNDVVAFEDLQVQNMVKNHHLAKSITDASWSIFRQWIEYFGKMFGVITVAVPPHNTSQKCSNCGAIVKKSLSTRTHVCACNTVLCRDENAARNILELGLRTVGHTGTSSLELENASEETDQYLSEATPSSKSTRGKRKSKK